MEGKSSRRLFCELSPTAYALSAAKCRMARRVSDLFSLLKFAKSKQAAPLPVLIYKHQSLIRRKLGDVDPVLQENKAVNLALAAPKVNGILIRPGEVFSFWRLVGSCSARKGYREGLTIQKGNVGSGTGGGMCQFTNLIHWMVLHSPLEVIERHHHDGVDLFPDFGRRVPFGMGTSVLYNYLDYRFRNPTLQTFQLLVSTTETHLCGKLLAEHPLEEKYHIEIQGEHFSREGSQVYRNGQIYRYCIDKRTGEELRRELLQENHARVLYDLPGSVRVSEPTSDANSQ